jgi:hypothetical protein
MLMSMPQIFMLVVSGYYLEVMGVGPGVRVGLMLFTSAAAVAVFVRAVFLTETLGPEDMNWDDDGNEVKQNSTLNAFKCLPKTIYAMPVVAIITRFAASMT